MKAGEPIKISFEGINYMNDNKFILFNKMLNKQEELNNLTYPTWKEKLTTVDWQSAILVETGELLESFGYKWWKKQIADIDNVKVELIDILHFLLSNLLYISLDEYLKRKIENCIFYAYMEFCEEGFNDTYLDIRNDFQFKKILLKLIHSNEDTEDMLFQFFLLAKLFKYVGMNFDEVYRAYFIKNILNEFRQKNGCKNGTYKKIWKVDIGEGVKEYEDNAVVYHIAKQIPLEKLDEELMNKINEVYQKIKGNK